MASEIVTYKIEGMEEVIDAISALNSKETINIIRAVERRALNINITKPVRAAIPYAAYKKTIGVIADKKDKLGYFSGLIIKKREVENEPPIGVIMQWLDQGTDVRTTRKGANRGQLTRKNIIMPIIDSKASDIVDFFNQNFGEEVNRIMEKKIKKISS